VVFLHRFTPTPDHRYDRFPVYAARTVHLPGTTTGDPSDDQPVIATPRRSIQSSLRKQRCRGVSAPRGLRAPSRHAVERAHPFVCSRADTMSLAPRSTPSSAWSPPGGNGEHPRSDDQGPSVCSGSRATPRPGTVMDDINGCASEPGRRWPSGARARPAARCSGRFVASTVAARHRLARVPQRDGRPHRRR
jgi:hypothetical protein